MHATHAQPLPPPPPPPQEHVICHLRPSSEASPTPYCGGSPAYEDPQAEPERGERPAEAAAGAVPEAQLCQWCCHTFDGVPVAVPIRRAGDSYVVSGQFCTYACSAASIFGEHDDSHAAWTRYQMLNDMRRDACAAPPGVFVGPVVRAPPRAALRQFGGHLTADEFRARSADSALVMRRPPMVVEQPRVEEIPTRHLYRDLYVPIDEERVSRYKVRLHRARPKPTLMHALQGYVPGEAAPSGAGP